MLVTVDNLRPSPKQVISPVGLCRSSSFYDPMAPGAVTNVSAVLWNWHFVHGVETPWCHGLESVEPHVFYVELEIQRVAHFTVSIDEV